MKDGGVGQDDAALRQPMLGAAMASREVKLRARPTTIVPLALGAVIVVAAGFAVRPRTRPQAEPAPAGTAAPQDAGPATGGRYDFARPLRTFALPPSLREVSAVTSVDARTVACLQDEKGVLFLVDVIEGRVRAVHPFGPDGDYEGLARVGADYYVLRSDGALTRLTPSGKGFAAAGRFQVEAPNQNFEGLGHDATRGVLLIAPKDIVKPDKDEPKRRPERDGGRRKGRADTSDEAATPSRKVLRDQRVLFGWDLTRRALLPEPVLRLSVDELRQQAEARGDEVPTRTNKRGKERTALRLLFSCVAVQPGTGDLYLLSAVDHLLIVVDRQGSLRQLHLLDADVLPQPEGLTFLPNGDLVLSSEGVDGPARLAVYRRT